MCVGATHRHSTLEAASLVCLRQHVGGGILSSLEVEALSIGGIFSPIQLWISVVAE